MTQNAPKGGKTFRSAPPLKPSAEVREKYAHALKDVGADSEVVAAARGFPGDTTAEDWDGTRWNFWRVDDHGKKGLARSERTKKRPDKVVFVFCEEHKDFEARRFLITANEALYSALDSSSLSVLQGLEDGSAPK